ncbi:HalOD1 output domain-containing protein [Haloarcula sediminis]|uniref:HalOD1 output domain-containing protein n=1 Tax=Haloarcula sediminis TaxID=3111777 RepID=UPI002D76AC82|nr:HalOD1 output domain-containing protein [Haloarcula sp. CK38]
MSANACNHRPSTHVFVRSDAESLSDTVIRAVSTASGRSPTPGPGADASLDPLYTAIDPDALDSVFTADGSAGTVTFDYHGYTVTAHSAGRVVLDA